MLNGRYGPYITDGSKNTPVPKNIEDPKTLTLEDCEALLKNAKPARGRKKAGKKKAAKRKQIGYHSMILQIIFMLFGNMKIIAIH